MLLNERIIKILEVARDENSGDFCCDNCCFNDICGNEYKETNNGLCEMYQSE